MDWGNAILTGLVATAVTTALMYLGKAMGMPMDMPDARSDVRRPG